MSEHYHPGDDVDEPDMADVLAEEDHDDAILGGEFDVETPGEDPETPIAHENESACRWCREAFDTPLDEGAHVCPDRREWALSQVEHDAAVIEPQPHEFGAHLLFHAHGMSPYWAIVSQFDHAMADEGETDDVGTFAAAGETWELNHEEEKVKYWEGKIAAEGQDFEAFNEYQINVVADDDAGVGRKRINFRFRPSFPRMKHVDTGDEMQGVPSGLPEGIRVEVDSANLAFEEILAVLQALAEVLDINPEYFRYDALHGWSSAYNTAAYVRLRREIASERLTPLDTGLLDRMAEFGKRQRGRGEYKWNHEEIEGHRMAVALDASTRSKFGLDATVGTLSKLYYPKHPPDDLNNPLAHPKFEIQFSSEYTDAGAIPIDSDLPTPTGEGEDAIDDDDTDGALPEGYDLDALRGELDEWLLNSLYWADVPIRADPQVYVADAYWTPAESERDIRLVEDPMPTMRERERRLAEHHVFSADATPDQRAVMDVATDGGPQSIDDVAAAAGVSERTVRRAAETFGTVLEVVDGEVAAADGVIREKVDQLLATLGDAADWAQQSIEDVLADREQTIDEDSAFAKWMRTYGVNLVEEGSDTEIAVHVGHYTKAEIQAVLREGLEAARHTGHNIHDILLRAGVSWYDQAGDRRRAERAFAIQGNGISVLGNILARIG